MINDMVMSQILLSRGLSASGEQVLNRLEYISIFILKCVLNIVKAFLEGALLIRLDGKVLLGFFWKKQTNLTKQVYRARTLLFTK
jgi:hypothetical protein